MIIHPKLWALCADAHYDVMYRIYRTHQWLLKKLFYVVNKSNIRDTLNKSRGNNWPSKNHDFLSVPYRV